jgi:hypothetical protein
MSRYNAQVSWCNPRKRCLSLATAAATLAYAAYNLTLYLSTSLHKYGNVFQPGRSLAVAARKEATY